MEIPIGELVEFVSNGLKGYDNFVDRPAQVIDGLLERNTTTLSGVNGVLLGYKVKFLDTGYIAVVKPAHLKRIIPVRGDMDRILTWDYVHQTIGWRPREGE